jgi:uncharacterized protein (DUF58 family)
MFRKERDIELPAEVMVWPRADRPVRAPAAGAGRLARSGASRRSARGTRGEYRSLRGYRAGDDPKDIHWRSSARLREPVIREYERDGAETRWLCLDTRGPADEAAEVAIEIAASLASMATAEHRPFGLVAGEALLEPGTGAGQLERALDILARVDFAAEEPAPDPPVDRMAAVLVSVYPQEGFGDVYAVGPGALLDGLEDLEATQPSGR